MPSQGPIRAFLAALCAIAVLAAYSVAAAADRLSIGALRLVSSAPLFIAQDRGYFAAEGLAVDIRFHETARDVARAAADGETDLGITGLTADFYALAGKGALRIVAAQAREEPGFEFVAYVVNARAHAAGFTSVAQFPGKTVGVTTIGSTFHYSLGRLAVRRDFRIEDVLLRPLGSIAGMADALKAGEVDAVLLPAEIARRLENEGSGRIIGWVSEETPWQLGALFANAATLDDRRAAVERFVRAYRRATADYAGAMLQRDKDGRRVFGAEADALAATLLRYLEPGATVAQIKAATPYIDAEARLLVRDIHHQLRWYQAAGMVDREADAGRMLDLSFVPDHLDVPRP